MLRLIVETIFLMRFVGLEQMPCNGDSRHDDTDHRHQFDQDVETRTGCIFKWISDCISNDCCLMAFRTLSSEVSFLDHFFCVIPGPTGVCHEYRKHETCTQSSGQQSHDSRNTKDESCCDRYDDGQK